MRSERFVRGTSRFSRALRDYAQGLSTSEVRRVFDREAGQAFRVLTREHAEAPRPAGRLRALLHDARLLFVGISFKLTPARRVLFALSLILALFGLLGFEARTGEAAVDFSPIPFLGSIALLTLLLTLELVDRVTVRDELEVARALQAELLPKTAPELPGYRFAHSYRAARQVGGDYYGFYPLPDGRLVIAAGDASGHGMAAGLVMAIARSALELALEIDPHPLSVTALVNRVLMRTGDRRSFMTLFVGVLEPASGRLSFVCAGHPFPMLHRVDGSVLELGCGALPLGIRPALEAREESITIAAGETLLLYSDGLPEAVAGDGSVLGFERITAAVAGTRDARALHDHLQRLLSKHSGQEPLHDDVTLVVLERTQEAPESS